MDLFRLFHVNYNLYRKHVRFFFFLIILISSTLLDFRLHVNFHCYIDLNFMSISTGCIGSNLRPYTVKKISPLLFSLVLNLLFPFYKHEHEKLFSYFLKIKICLIIISKFLKSESEKQLWKFSFQGKISLCAMIIYLPYKFFQVKSFFCLLC